MKYKKLLNNTRIVSPNSINNVRFGVRVSDFDAQYDIKGKTLLFTGLLHSPSSNNVYNVSIKFIDVDPTEGLTSFEIKKGYLPKPSMFRNDIKFNCNCLSNIFRFDYPNRFYNMALGPGFKPYRRKTNRKSNNPRNLPGMCKHIQEFMRYLKSNGFVK